MREAQVNIAIRWFTGYGLHEKLPHHSSLTRIRQRWGAERFRKIFKRTVEACLKATIATGEIVHVDASLIRANVSWESLVERHVVEVFEENKIEEEVEAEKRDRQSKCKKVCVTDRDATMATNARNRHLEPCYKQHTAVDDKVGVILDVEVTTGEKDEGQMIEPQVDEELPGFMALGTRTFGIGSLCSGGCKFGPPPERKRLLGPERLRPATPSNAAANAIPTMKTEFMYRGTKYGLGDSTG